MNLIIEIRFECPHCGYHHTITDGIGDITGDLVAKCSNCHGMIAIIWSLAAEATVYSISSDNKGQSVLSAQVQNDDYTDEVEDDSDMIEELPS